MQRKPYLDNIRWQVVLLVLVYHVFYMFNAVGVLGGVGAFATVQPQDVLLYAVYPWFMLLLFVVAGICARYTLEKTDIKSFIKARTQKLLVPSTLGLVVFQWIVGYFNVKASGALENIPVFIRYPVFVLSGTGPLWFIQLLWVFSLLLCLIYKIDKGDKLYALGGRFNLVALLASVLLIFGAAQVLNASIISVYRFGIYFMGFLLGYAVFSHDIVQDTIEKASLPLLLAALVAGIAEVTVYWGQNYADNTVLKAPLTNLFAWLAVLAVLGCGKRWCNKTTPFSIAMTKSSFGIYIVHYLLVIAPCYYMKNHTSLPAPVIYLLGLMIVLLGSPLLYALLRRIPVVRYLVLGVRKG